MRNVPDSTGSDGYGETPGEAGNSSASSPGKAFYQELISRANTVPITRVFKHYGLRLDEHNRKIICPIPSHKGGRENSASFYYYPQTNTFWCFGCKTGIHCCDLVAAMDSISKAKAAFKLLEWFADDVDEDGILDNSSFSERLEIMIDFSNAVRDFRATAIDQKSIEYIEHVCSVYDRINLKLKLDNEGLRRLVEEIKQDIKSHKTCPTP
jgi:hypothetical protein